MVDGKVSTNEIMDFLQQHMVTREEFAHLEIKVDGLEAKVDKLEVKVDGLDQKLNITKLDLLDAMDDKLANLKGDLVVLMRKEDQKVNELIALLAKKKVISENDAVHLTDLRPFPQSTV